MSITILAPKGGTTVTACPVVVTVEYDATSSLAPAAGGADLPAGWFVRSTFSKTGFSKSTGQSLEGAPIAGTADVTFGAGDIPDGTGYKVEADLIQPGGGVHSSATPEEPVDVDCE